MREGKCPHYFFGCFSIEFLSQVAITICSGRHVLFWPLGFVLAVTICSGHHYLLTEIEWRISQNNNDDICLPICLFFIIGYYCYVRYLRMQMLTYTHKTPLPEEPGMPNIYTVYRSACCINNMIGCCVGSMYCIVCCVVTLHHIVAV